MKVAYRNILILVLAIILIIALGLFFLFGKAKDIAHVRYGTNIYAQANAGMLSPVVKSALHRVYVPNGFDNTVSVIDSDSYKVIDTFKTGKYPQHVVPSYDLKTLWVLNNSGNTLTPIDPDTGKPKAQIPVKDPYNLYFTPDGKYAIVVAESLKRFDFVDPQTMKLVDTVPVQCKGINHMEFTVDGRYAIATCEFSGQLVKLDLSERKVVGYLTFQRACLKRPSMPQDIRSTADGKVFYVADMMMNGVFLIDPNTFRQIGFIPTGIGTHGIYPSRDGRYLYVSNRGCTSSLGCAAPNCRPNGPGSIAVIDPKLQKVIAIWPIQNGGSPDMGNVSVDGKELWLSGRYDSVVYVFNTSNGLLTHRIPVGRGPHGLTVWPQPGRYSLGHTGNMR